MKNKVLVVVAHPDDEVLWVGGTILKHVDNGDEIEILILSSWEDSRWEDVADNEKRRKQAKIIKTLSKVKNLHMENLPDNAFDTVSLLKIAQVVEKYVDSFEPNIVYTHFQEDLNIDHRLTFQAVMTACRPQPNVWVNEIYTFETLSSTEWQVKTWDKIFKPTKYVNIDKYIDQKMNILKIYKDELREYPHPRSLKWVEVLARYRWIEVGLGFAEAFEVIRCIEGK